MSFQEPIPMTQNIEWEKDITIHDMTVYPSLGMLRICDKLVMNDCREFQDYTSSNGTKWFKNLGLYTELTENGAVHFYIVGNDGKRYYQDLFKGPMYQCMSPLYTLQGFFKKRLSASNMRKRAAAISALHKRLPVDIVMKCLDFF